MHWYKTPYYWVFPHKKPLLCHIVSQYSCHSCIPFTKTGQKRVISGFVENNLTLYRVWKTNASVIERRAIVALIILLTSVHCKGLYPTIHHFFIPHLFFLHFSRLIAMERKQWAPRNASLFFRPIVTHYFTFTVHP